MPRSSIWIPMSLLMLVLAGCPRSVIPDYEARRALALATPTPVGEHWVPDARLHVAEPALQRFVSAQLDASGTIDTTITTRLPLVGPVEVRPRLKIQRLEVAPSSRCGECVTLDGDLDGTLHWRMGSGADSAPMRAAVTVDARLQTVQTTPGTWELTLQPAAVTDLDVDLKGGSFALGPILQSVAGEWLRDELLDELKAIPIGRFGTDELPIRAARVASTPDGVHLDLLTSAMPPAPIGPPGAAPTDGVRLDITRGSIVALVGAQTWAMGPVAHDVVVEITDLRLDGDTFDLGLRLWRPVGKGWWRDYLVRGELVPVRDGYRLKATSADEVGQSKGAGWADPLAALAEGRILEAIEQSVTGQLPSVLDTRAGKVDLQVRLGEPSTDASIVSFPGALVLGDDGSPRKPRRR